MNPNSTPILIAAISVILSGLIIFLERAFPFLLFSKKEPPALIKFIERFIPPMVITALLVYCLKDLSLTQRQNFVPAISALTLTILLHIWKRNSLISIFSGTILYMVLIKII